MCCEYGHPVGATIYEEALKEYPEYFQQDYTESIHVATRYNRGMSVAEDFVKIAESSKYNYENGGAKKDRSGGNNRKKVKRKKRNKRR